MDYNVFYESWQMQCCGMPVSVGEKIEWIVDKITTINTPVKIGKIDYCYEAHSSEYRKLYVLEGVVEKIDVLYERYEQSSDKNYYVPVDGKLINVKTADGEEEDIDDLSLSGYVVKLRDCSVRRAKREEVTFN